MDSEDKKRFEAMYLEYQNILRRIAYVNNIPMDYIDDVVQDTFVTYARYDYSLELPPAQMKGLLARILKSKCIDYHRKMKYRMHGEWEDGNRTEEIGNFESTGPIDLEDLMVSDERCRAILDEIEKMPENWRAVAVLKMIEGRPTREVCRILNISEKACYSRVSRIREHLERLLKDENWP